MKRYCENCGKEVETKVVHKKETYEVYGEPIDVDAEVLICANCGEELYSEELDTATIVSAYNKYRKRHKLLLPAEIKEIREQYGLSQRAFSRLLNWGDKTIYRYENGSLQDKAHNSLLLLLRDPENMKTYLTENEVTLGSSQKNKLLITVEHLEQSNEHRIERKFLDLLFAKLPSEENGYKTFDYDKFYSMVLFFAHRGAELLKTKLMKLMNYSDMIFYKENGISISGARYVHLPYGPVPENYDFLFGAMAADHIAHIEIDFDNGYEKHKVIADEKMPTGILSESELSVLKRVSDKFADFGSAEISRYSHNEKGYSETNKGQIISYAYAKYINLD